MLVTREQAQADLGQYVARLVRCVTDGIADFLKLQAPLLAFMRPGTQASLVRDYIVRNIKVEFPDGEDGIVHRERRGLFLLSIRNKYALRFKKMDARWRTRNSPTQLSLDYLLQQPMVLFPDLHEVTHLNVGYQPGVTLASSSYWITCPNGDKLEWKFSISADEEGPDFLADRSGPRPRPSDRDAARARPRQAPDVAADGPSA